MEKDWKTIKKGDYLYALVPEHPFATKNGYVLEHRVVVERNLGRFLTKEEVVHHVDENKHNNKIENLLVLSKSEHTSLHHKTGRTFKLFTCPVCGKEFKKELHQIKRGVRSKCSRKCNGLASRMKQLGRL